ncbi:reverse transcriptase domain-containing protein [Tanacetum coccineum]|uniref:Reverse transcriptase domain-containing protein n=1 Tax=Tanacetum coccineum TaxID=301880 RepID=A0ABQ5G3Y7_9ASTR
MQTSSEVTNPKVLLALVETRPRRPGKEPMQLEDTKERRQLDKGRRLPKSGVEEKIVVNDNYLVQLVTIGGGLSAECRHALIHTFRKNVDIFAWTPTDMTGIPRAITEHSLDTYPHIEPKAQKKRSLAPDRRKVVTDEVNEWLKAGIEGRAIPTRWLLNPCASQKMTKNDEEKMAFHTEEGVFYYTKMPFGLKNAGATYYRLINMKLNPKKCSFGIEEGKFLGYIVTSEGIRANPEKAKAVMDMPSPKTLKQMQSLKAAEAAFLEMKKLVSELPTLTTPKKGETLMMYLSYPPRSEAVISACSSQKGWESRLPIQLCPIGKVLSNSGASGRLAKWAIELGTYGITYVSRVAIKGQVLADFLVDTPTEINATAEVVNNPRGEDIPEFSNAREDLTPGLKAWRLYTNGASNNEGSRASLILIAPDDVEYSYALRLNFSNSNNDAEYEALLVGLRIAKEMQVLELAGAFNRFRITHIPIAENMKADALIKLSAVQFDHLSKEVLVEVLNERSVEAQEVNIVVEEEGPTWMTPIRNYLKKGNLPKDLVDARTLMEKIGNYTMEDGVLYRFGIPATIITDNETQFVNDPFKKWAEKLKIRLISNLVYHPQGNGAVERANKSLLRGIKTRLKKGGSAWAEEDPPGKGLTKFPSIPKQAYKLSNQEGKRYPRLGMLVTSEGATCKNTRVEQPLLIDSTAEGKKGGEQTRLPFAHNKYTPVSSYIGWRKRHENINLNVASKCIRAQTVPVGLPHALAHGLQPESCCGKTGPCWPDPYKSRHLSDK